MFDLSTLKTKYRNPRKISDKDFEKLQRSVLDFPKMLTLRPIVYDPETMEVLGGNQRLKALLSAGYKEIPVEWIRSAGDLTEEEKQRFVVQDNVEAGQWDFDYLLEDFAKEDLEEWGVDVPEDQEQHVEGQIRFSEELDHESNYVVLKFSTDIDFIHIQSILGLESTYSKRQNGKPWSKGMGRVVDGVDAILKIKQA